MEYYIFPRFLLMTTKQRRGTQVTLIMIVEELRHSYYVVKRGDQRVKFARQGHLVWLYEVHGGKWRCVS